ncbi:hypothetical protein A4A49_20449 [Nicotiana attenuata]|uniref:Uncharacterized protein n=1 Tax=Nicotiana attenuata TaxID=49451 RepID=A0A1J6IKN1_NICAT|nr:hypothetical protein A4A49_20449 [Nicotiana attenuata]
MSILLLSAKLAVEKGIDQGGSESYFTKLSDYIILSLVEALHKVLCDGEDLVTEETAKRMIILLRNFQKTLPAATWASTLSFAIACAGDVVGIHSIT